MSNPIKTSDSIAELATALAVAQGVIEGAVKDSSNPFFKSKYADLASVWDAIRKPLSDNGLCVMQLPTAEGARVTITTILAHKSGQWISSELTVTAKEDGPQAVGSAITYVRRYALQSVVGVAPEDDDGNAAHGQSHQQPAASAPRQTSRSASPDPEFKAIMLAGFNNMLAKYKEIDAENEFLQVLGANGYTAIAEIPVNRGVANEVMNSLKTRLADLKRT